MTSQKILDPKVEKFLEEINNANTFPNTCKTYRNITFDNKSNLFIIETGNNVVDYSYTSHNSVSYFIKYPKFIKSLDSLINLNNANFSTEAIRLLYKGHHDTTMTIDTESNAIIQRGTIEANLRLENRTFSTFEFRFNRIGKCSEITRFTEYFEPEEMKKLIEEFAKELN